MKRLTLLAVGSVFLAVGSLCWYFAGVADTREAAAAVFLLGTPFLALGTAGVVIGVAEESWVFD